MVVAKEFDIAEARRRLEEEKRKVKWWQIRKKWKLERAEEFLKKLELLQFLGVDIKFIEIEEDEEERDGRDRH